MANMFENGIERQEGFNPFKGHSELELTHCGYERCEPRFAVRASMHDSFLIHYIISGNGFFQQGGNTFAVGPGQLFTIFSGNVVSYYAPEPDDPWIFCWFGFMGKSAIEILKSAGISYEHPVCRLQSDQPFLDTLQECTDELSFSNSITNSMLKSYMYKLFHLLEESHLSSFPRAESQGRLDKLFQEGEAFIEYNYNKPISVQDVARHMKVDRTYCWKIFRQYTGQSTQQYLMNYRINKSAELLHHSGMSLSEAAQGVGISDLNYFSRLFKKIKGISPSRYAFNPEE